MSFTQKISAGVGLEILTYIWGILSVGIIVSLGIALVGGRRV